MTETNLSAAVNATVHCPLQLRQCKVLELQTFERRPFGLRVLVTHKLISSSNGGVYDCRRQRCCYVEPSTRQGRAQWTFLVLQQPLQKVPV